MVADVGVGVDVAGVASSAFAFAFAAVFTDLLVYNCLVLKGYLGD